MTAGCQLVDFEERHRPALLRFYRRNFGAWAAERFAARWQWQFGTGNPYLGERAAQIRVGVVGDDVVAHLAAFPLPLRLAGERTVALCESDFAVDPAYPMLAATLIRGFRRHAPIVNGGSHPAVRRMLAMLGAVFLPATEVQLVYTLTNRGVARRALARRLPPPLRGLARTPLAWLARPFVRAARERHPRPPLPAPDGPVEVRPLDGFGPEVDALWAEASQDVPHAFEKDARHLEWRYRRGPARRLHCLGAYAQGRLRGLAVVGSVARLAAGYEPLGHDGEFLEVIVAPGETGVARALFLAGAQPLQEEGAESLRTTGLTPWLAGVARELGFVARPSASRSLAVTLAPGPRPAGIEDAAQWFTSPGDADTLYTLTL
ncbi:MAG: hypothetical protein IT458_18255 [Planctomycetes bacterium]|nr:hypothetical protein [Planctomycetota bacterium]